MDIGRDFNITISASAFDPLSRTTKTSGILFILAITDKVLCSASSLVDKPINDMSNKVSLSYVTQDVLL